MFSFPTFPSIQLGPLTLHTFGLFVAIGVLVGAEVTARRNLKFGVSREDTQWMVMWLAGAGLVGARLTWVITSWDEIDSPLDIIAVWEGGMQFSGGFLLAFAILPWVTRRARGATDQYALIDSAALGLAVGQAFGRVGCISVGEHLGGPTDFFLGWTYTGGTTREGPLMVGQTYHNAALYELLWLLVLIVVLVWRSRRLAYSGQVMVWFLAAYGVLRFATDTVREYDQRLGGLTGAQYACIALVVGSVVLGRRWARKSLEARDIDAVDPGSAATAESTQPDPGGTP